MSLPTRAIGSRTGRARRGVCAQPGCGIPCAPLSSYCRGHFSLASGNGGPVPPDSIDEAELLARIGAGGPDAGLGEASVEPGPQPVPAVSPSAVYVGPSERVTLDLLADGPKTAAQIGRLRAYQTAAISQHLLSLTQKGLVYRVSKGLYAAVSEREPHSSLDAQASDVSRLVVGATETAPSRSETADDGFDPVGKHPSRGRARAVRRSRSRLRPGTAALQGARQGTPMTPAAALARYDGMVCAIAAGYYAPGFDRDDMRQEARIALLEAVRIHRHDGGASLATFARIIVRRHLMDLVTRERRLKRGADRTVALELVLDEDLRLADVLANPRAPDPLRIVVERERLATITRVLSRELSPLEREAVTGYINGESYAETEARIVQGPEGDRPGRAIYTPGKVVDNALARARRKVTVALEELAA